MKNLATVNWNKIESSLDKNGFARIPDVLSISECNELKVGYHHSELYRSTINMQRYRFGKGEYKYFKYPLPQLIQLLRENFYSHLATIANQWMKRLNQAVDFPDSHEELILKCHSIGQSRPTPLILHYETDGFNTLHQDLYGDVYFPFQVVFALSVTDKDYNGGEFILVEQVPRAQSKAQAIKLEQGEALIFTTNFRPVNGTRGYYKARIKHGVSPIISGERYAIGIIFHDAL